ncbi:hypothetical protein QB94_16820 [Salmonella enterica subsp. enterica serovar Newport]|nr:hypothetical protein [Salmonella enterica subsp. enterica serovar Newport]
MLVTFILLVSGCAQSTLLNRGGNTKSYYIMCGAATGWGICYNKANELCPSGYRDVSKQSGFNRKELIIECLP